MKKIGLTGIIIFLIINLCLGANWEKIYDLNTIDHGFSEVIASKNGGYIGVTNLSTSTYLVKMNAVGDTIWTQNFSEGTFLRGIGVVEDTVSNDITFIGGSFNANNDRSIVLLRSDANGNELWRQVIGNPGDSLSPVHFINTSDGGFLVTGWSRSKSAFFLKTDGLGNTSWTKFYSDLTGNGELYGTSVAELLCFF
ncbi:MAG: hypothetical protein MRY83_17925 [Flavobacteriales bacterium]|nr:hypothetical protein [Flavobacteriales bacterium]